MAQEKGFKVFLNMSPFDKEKEKGMDVEQWFSGYEEIVLRWAKYAEELGVEAFGPEGELGWIEYDAGVGKAHQRPNGEWYFRTPRLASWIRQLIPKVRQRYSGSIIIQELPSLFPDIDFTGADYMGLHLHADTWAGSTETYVPGVTTRKYRERIRKELDAGQEAARRDGCKVMISEASFGCIDMGLGCGSHTQVNEQQQKQLCEAFFDEAWGETDGVFPIEWGSDCDRALTVDDRPTEDVVRRYYQSC